MDTAKAIEYFQDAMKLQANILLRGVTDTKRKRMTSILDKFFKAVGEDNIPRNQYYEYWWEG
jgi:hypothetical protein